MSSDQPTGRSATDPVTLTRATPADRATLVNLLQLYFYDFSEFTDDDESLINDCGHFPPYEDLDSYLSQPDRLAFLVRAGGRLAGFVLVQRLDRHGREPTWGMQEFFIVRYERRRGIGRRAAVAAFMLLPGRWEVGELHANTAAIAFWRRVISDFTGGHYSEEGTDDLTTPGPLQIFWSPPDG